MSSVSAKKLAVGSLLLEIQVSNCWLSCKHCYASSFSKAKSQMPLEKIFWCVDFFRKIAPENLTIYLYKDLLDYSQKFEFLNFLSRNNYNESLELLPTHGWIRDSNDIKHTTSLLSAAGVKKVWLTLHGSKEKHDLFVRRPGAYEHILKFSEHALDADIDVEWNLMARKSNIEDLLCLMRTEEIAASKNRFFVSTPAYVGRGMSIADDRPTIQMINILQESGAIKSTDIFSELEWEYRINKLRRLSTKYTGQPYAEVQVMPDYSIHLRDFPNSRKIGSLLVDSPESILKRLLECESLITKLRRNTPDEHLQALCQESGRGGNEAHCIYSIVSMWAERSSLNKLNLHDLSNDEAPNTMATHNK